MFFHRKSHTARASNARVVTPALPYILSGIPLTGWAAGPSGPGLRPLPCLLLNLARMHAAWPTATFAKHYQAPVVLRTNGK